MDQIFYLCSHCGNIITKVRDQGVPVLCCGEKMQPIVPGTTDASQEKHIPVCQQQGDQVTVTVGTVAHPMTEEHLIEWICLQTKQGLQLRRLKAGDQPQARFVLEEGDEVEAVFAFCNLHSLWKA